MQSDGGFYYVPSPLAERPMIPLKYFEELETAPVDKVDFVATFIGVFVDIQLCDGDVVLVERGKFEDARGNAHYHG